MSEEILDLDVHINKIGNGRISRFLILITLIGFLTFILDADICWIALTAYSPNYHCNVKELNSLPLEIQKNISMPVKFDGTYDSCHIFDLNYSLIIDNFNISSYGFSQENLTVRPCMDWTYVLNEIGDTVVTEYDWVCDNEMMYEYAVTISFGGMLVGGLLCGYLSDWFGRKRSFMIATAVKSLAYVFLSLSFNQYCYLIARFIINFFQIVITSNVSIFIYEFTSDKYRNILINVATFGFNIGMAGGSMMGYCFNGWRSFYYFVTVLAFLNFLCAFWIFESPRWLYLKGKVKDYDDVMKKIAKINNVKLMDGYTFHIPEIEHSHDSYVSIRKLFYNKKVSLITLVLFSQWFTTSLIYYGIALNVTSLYGDVLLNLALMGLVGLPFRVIVTIMTDHKYFGRKYSLMTQFVISGLFTIAIVPCMLVKSDQILGTIFAVSAISVIECIFCTASTYTSELYPTEIRNIGFLTCSSMARISGIVSPYFGPPLQQVWKPLPYLLFGLMSILTASLIITLPETLGKPLTQKIDDIQNKLENDFPLENYPR